MTSDQGKRPRFDEPSNIRTIHLDLVDFPPWVREASNDELIKIFEIGVLVKESTKLNVTFKQKEIDDLLTEKFDPMSATIKTLATDVSSESKKELQNIGKEIEDLKKSVTNKMMETQQSLFSSVRNVVDKVPPLTAINSKIESVEKCVSSKVETVNMILNSNVIESLKRCETKLDAINTTYNKATTKGHLGEIEVVELLRELKSHTTEHVASKKGEKGDIHVTSPNQHKYLIEVKNYEKSVPGTEIEKFENDVKSSPEFRVGILLSLRSGIAQRARKRRFQVAYVNKQYFIYVPNMSRDTALAVWSVSLADELVSMSQGDLDHAKLAAVTALYEEFKVCIDKTNKCQANLNTLKETVKSLSENLSPVLDIVKNAKKKLNAILNK